MRRILSVAAMVTIAAFSVLTSVIVGGALLGLHPVVVAGGSMAPTLRPGAVVLFSDAPQQPPAAGTIVLIDTGGGSPITHRVIRQTADGMLVTSGDANTVADSDPVPLSAVAGEARLVVPLIGAPRLFGTAYWLQALTVTLLLVLAAGVLLVPALRRRGYRRVVWPVAMTGLVTAALFPVGAAFTATTQGTTDRLAASASFGPSYYDEVRADTPQFYYRLDETSGTTMTDSSTNGTRVGTYGFAATNGDYRVTGATSDGDQGTRLPGEGSYLATPTSMTSRTEYTLELWIKTSTTQGGMLWGFGEAKTGLLRPGTLPSAGSRDEVGNDAQLYMASTGTIVFRSWYSGSSSSVVRSSAAYNDNAWHHVVVTASLTARVQRLFVDGTEQFTAIANPSPLDATRANYNGGLNYAGYWRIGSRYANPSVVPGHTDFGVNGQYDEGAFYTTALSSTRVSAHYAARTGAYATTVLADSPWAYYRMADANNTAADSSGNSRHGLYRRGLIGGEVAGAVGSNYGRQMTTLRDATSVTWTENAMVSQTQYTNPSNYTVELWFKTTDTVKGGLLACFCNNKNESSGNITDYDRIVIVKPNGAVAFGKYVGGSFYNATSSTGFNDGNWHHVVATHSTTAGMRLYVDGSLNGSNANTGTYNISGWWRFGSKDQLYSWETALALGNERPTFEGALDEIAYYSSTLSAARVSAHYAARTRS